MSKRLENEFHKYHKEAAKKKNSAMSLSVEFCDAVKRVSDSYITKKIDFFRRRAAGNYEKKCYASMGDFLGYVKGQEESIGDEMHLLESWKEKVNKTYDSCISNLEIILETLDVSKVGETTRKNEAKERVKILEDASLFFVKS